MREQISQPDTNASARDAVPKVIAMQWYFALCGACLVTAGCAATAAQAPTPAEAAAATPPPYTGPTIPKLLGCQDGVKIVAKCAEKVCTCLKQQFPGPGAEAPNLGEVGPQSSPAAKCAADIIAAEEKAPQTIDALRYLGRVGCTKCYPCVEEGLLSALDDCTESVRFEAAKALRRTAEDQCNCCQYTNCCTQKVYEKLYKIAYEANAQGCPVEPSARVRRVARQTLHRCGGPMVTEEAEPTPIEGPSGEPPEEGPSAPAPAAEPAAGEGAATNANDEEPGEATAIKPSEGKQNTTAASIKIDNQPEPAAVAAGETTTSATIGRHPSPAHARESSMSQHNRVVWNEAPLALGDANPFR